MLLPTLPCCDTKSAGSAHNVELVLCETEQWGEQGQVEMHQDPDAAV